MEHRFGYDFSRVRLHSGSAADQSVRDVNARAYTAGHNIVFGAGRFEPRTHEGRRLIAHELTHVVQQSQPSTSQPIAKNEQQADRAANLTDGAPKIKISIGTAPGVIQRSPDTQELASPDTKESKPVRKIFVDTQLIQYIALGTHPEAEKKLQELKKDGHQIFITQQTVNELFFVPVDFADSEIEKEKDEVKKAELVATKAKIDAEFTLKKAKLAQLGIDVGPGASGGKVSVGDKTVDAMFAKRVEVYAKNLQPVEDDEKKRSEEVNKGKKPKGIQARAVLSEPDILHPGLSKQDIKGNKDRNDILVAAQVVAADGELFTLDQNILKRDKEQKKGEKEQKGALEKKIGLRIAPESWEVPPKPNSGPAAPGSPGAPPPPAGPTTSSSASAPTAKQATTSKAPATVPVQGMPPVGPTAPPAVVTTRDPRTVGQLYSSNLVQEYRGQQILYQFSRAALDNLEAKEAKAKGLGTELSDEDKHAKSTLTVQVAAAQARMLQARRDYEMLDSPGATPQQLQEMFARRGIAIPVVAQTDKSGAAALKDSGVSPWGLDDKGFTKKSGTASTQTVIGPDGTPVTFTKDASSVTAIGLGTASKVTSDKDTAVSGDRSITTDQQRTKSVDLIKGEGSYAKGTVTEIKDDAAGTSTKAIDKTTYAAGLSGITKTKDDSTQVGSKLDSTSSTVGVTRGPGQLGLTAGNTTKSGTMVGPPGQEKMESGTEKSQKLTGGLVSDDKGTGIGGAASQDRKTLFGDGKSIATKIAVGGRCQVLVKEIVGSDPPKFTITTTISFDAKLGATAGKEWEAKPGAQQDTGLKANVSASGGVALGMYASFTRQLPDAEAKQYIEFIRANGHGSALPEHKILATGMDEGWDTAKKLWQSMSGSPAMLKSMKSDESVDTNVELAGEATVGAGGGQSAQGGLSLGVEASAKAKHKINVSRRVMPDGKIQVAAAIDDEGEIGGTASVGIGAAGAKFGKSYTKGQGRAVVFVLDPKDVAFDSQIAAINSAATTEDLDRLAALYHAAEKTDKTVEGEGTTVGASIGPLSIDMGGRGKLSSEVTRDQEGKVIASKYTGENQGGGTFGIGDLKAGDSKTEAYVGEVDKEGHAKGEISATTKSTSVSKSVLKAGGKLTGDPLGTLMNPGKLVEEETEQKGTAIADPEIMSVCYSALDKSKWDWKVGGHRHDDWVAAGNKIRNACTVRGRGREAEIVQVDKHAVQQALAEWTKADVEGRKEALDALIRPLGGVPGGKAFSFPDGTESMKADWDALAVADPLEGARAKLAAKKPQEAQAEMLVVKSRLGSLYASVKSASKKWEGLEIQHAEMLGHISARINEVDTAVRNLGKTGPSLPKAAAPAAVTTVPTAAEVHEQEGRDRANEARADLEIYNNNIETMKGYAEAVFKKLGQAEAKINDDSFFAGSKGGRIQDSTPLIKDAEDLIKRWDGLYWPTFKLYEKWSPFIALDKSRIEKLHPAGARGRWQQVYDLTRDKSMAGR